MAANEHYGLRQKVAKLLEQLRDKKTEVKLLKSMVHPSSAAGGAGVAAPTASSSASSPASSSAAQQRIAQLEAKVAELESHSAAVMRDWRKRAGFYEEGDESAEAHRQRLLSRWYASTGQPDASDGRLGRYEKLHQQVTAREKEMLLSAAKVIEWRIEIEALEIQIKKDASKRKLNKENEKVLTKARTIEHQANQEKERAKLALAQLAL